MNRAVLGIGAATAVFCSCGGETTGPQEMGPGYIHYTGTVTVDGGRPFQGSIRLLPHQFHQIAHTHRNTEASRGPPALQSTGPYEIKGSVQAEYCDQLWLVVFGREYLYGPINRPLHYRYLPDGCGEHTLNIDITTNIQVTGTVTLDGSPYSGEIGVVVGQMPPDLVPYVVLATWSSVAGEYAFLESFDPAFCHDLWIWLRAVDHLEKVPGCGPQVVNVDAVSG